MPLAHVGADGRRAVPNEWVRSLESLVNSDSRTRLPCHPMSSDDDNHDGELSAVEAAEYLGFHPGNSASWRSFRSGLATARPTPAACSYATRWPFPSSSGDVHLARTKALK